MKSIIRTIYVYFVNKKGDGTMVKFYNGRTLVYTVITNNAARAIAEMIKQSDIEWTRYKIIEQA